MSNEEGAKAPETPTVEDLQKEVETLKGNLQENQTSAKALRSEVDRLRTAKEKVETEMLESLRSANASSQDASESGEDWLEDMSSESKTLWEKLQSEVQAVRESLTKESEKARTDAVEESTTHREVDRIKAANPGLFPLVSLFAGDLSEKNKDWSIQKSWDEALKDERVKPYLDAKAAADKRAAEEAEKASQGERPGSGGVSDGGKPKSLKEAFDEAVEEHPELKEIS